MIALLDEGAPVQIAGPFLSRSHQVIYHSDVLESGADDKHVVATSIVNEAVLIAVDLDMKRLVRRFGSPGNGEKFKDLDLISLSCNEVLAAKRLEQAMSLIENEWQVRCDKSARRMWVDIGPHRITSYR